MTFSVEQDTFSGPLGVLLELLDSKKLEITDVNLAQLADEYVAYIQNETVASEELADFLVIAARLIYLKSRELMPYVRLQEEEEKVEDLQEQLRVYRLFVRAAETLEEKFMASAHMCERPFVRVKRQQEVVFAPGEGLTASALREAFARILKRLQPFFALQEVSMERVKSVQERISEMTSVLQDRAKMNFKDIMKGARRKVDVVVSFLALLELARQKIVNVRQDSNDIVIERLMP